MPTEACALQFFISCLRRCSFSYSYHRCAVDLNAPHLYVVQLQYCCVVFDNSRKLAVKFEFLLLASYFSAVIRHFDVIH